MPAWETEVVPALPRRPTEKTASHPAPSPQLAETAWRLALVIRGSLWVGEHVCSWQRTHLPGETLCEECRPPELELGSLLTTPCPRLLPPCVLWSPSPAKPGWTFLKDPHPRATMPASRPLGSLGDIREDAAQIHVAGAFLLRLHQDLCPGPVLHCGWQLSSVMVSREARLSVTTVLLPSCLLP